MNIPILGRACARLVTLLIASFAGSAGAIDPVP